MQPVDSGRARPVGTAPGDGPERRGQAGGDRGGNGRGIGGNIGYLGRKRPAQWEEKP
jgi:hypothetical protein